MGNVVYKPGDAVPRNGIYRIDHHLHRLMHEATLTEGMRFPLCRKCEGAVKFFLVRVITGEVLPFRPTEILEDYPDVEAEGQSAG